MEFPHPVHVPVLGGEVLAFVGPIPTNIIVDCTTGLGGHSALLLKNYPEARVIGLDLDAANLEEAGRRLAPYEDRVRLVQANFADIRSVLDELGTPAVGAVLADLGVSSNQIADPGRGFSFDLEGPLDMRLDQSQKTTAGDLVNALPEDQLADLLYLQSQERGSRRIAKRICQARREGRLGSTVALARLVAAALGGRTGSPRQRIHPATRTFMALRMAVNRESESLSALLEQAPRCLVPGGRVLVISFHSGEDRLVKEDFRRRARAGQYRVLTRKPVIADAEERRENPRSRSAKLRVAELAREDVAN